VEPAPRHHFAGTWSARVPGLSHRGTSVSTGRSVVPPARFALCPRALLVAKISRLHVDQGANWAGRNAMARRSAFLEIFVDGDPFERSHSSLRLKIGRTNA